jgi:hypothetical protein
VIEAIAPARREFLQRPGHGFSSRAGSGISNDSAARWWSEVKTVVIAVIGRKGRVQIPAGRELDEQRAAVVVTRELAGSVRSDYPVVRKEPDVVYRTSIEADVAPYRRTKKPLSANP